MVDVDKQIKKIEEKISFLEEKLVQKQPRHFGVEDTLYAFFGSVLIGLTFLLKGALIRTALNFTAVNIIVIIVSTIIILAAQIYYVGYIRVRMKAKRPFGQFLLKRLVTMIVLSFGAAFFLVYVYGVNYMVPDFQSVFKVVVAMLMPCAVGAVIPAFFKRV